MNSIQQTKLSNLVDITSGFAFSSSKFNNDRKGLPIIRIRDLTSGEISTYYDGDFDEKYIVNSGDYLISMDGDFKLTEWSNGKALLNQRVCKIEVKTDNLYKKYLYYFLPKELKYIEDRTPFVTVKHLSTSKIGNLDIRLPSIDDQKKIAKNLELADSLRRKRRKAIDLLDEYVKSVFFEMFGDPVANTKNWDIFPLGNLLESMTSGSRGWAKYYSDKGSIFFTIKNVSRNNSLLMDNITYVNAPDNAEAKRTKVKSGDILISITADLGRTAVVPELNNDGYINQHLAILRLKNGINPHFISYYLSTNGGQIQIQKLNKGASKAGLNFSDVRSIKIQIPPLDIQDKFSNVLNKVDILRKQMINQSFEIENNFQSLLHQSFSVS